MDKISRVLKLYDALEHGERFTKECWCVENGVEVRSFDRDIEDIRLYLQDTYQQKEILYDRKNRLYYMTNCRHGEFDTAEWLAVEKLLVGSTSLSKDECYGLLKDLLSVTTDNTVLLYPLLQEDLKHYESTEPSLLKLVRDLNYCINKSRYILIQPQSAVFETGYVLPKDLISLDGKLHLIAGTSTQKEKFKIPLSEIESFTLQKGM